MTMSEAERIEAMKQGAEIAKTILVGIVSKFPTRAEVGADPMSAEYMHFQMCASTINALEFEDDDFKGTGAELVLL